MITRKDITRPNNVMVIFENQHGLAVNYQSCKDKRLIYVHNVGPAIEGISDQEEGERKAKEVLEGLCARPIVATRSPFVRTLLEIQDVSMVYGERVLLLRELTTIGATGEVKVHDYERIMLGREIEPITEVAINMLMRAAEKR